MKRDQFFNVKCEPESGIRRKPARAQGLHVASGADIAITVDDELPLIAAGLYQAAGGGARRDSYFQGTRITVFWTVLVPDDMAPGSIRKVVLPQFFNVTSERGRIRVGGRSKFWRAWVTVAGRRPIRGDRLTPRIFKGVLCTVQVRTVTEDFEQKPLTGDAQYSVIDDIVEVISGGG